MTTMSHRLDVHRSSKPPTRSARAASPRPAVGHRRRTVDRLGLRREPLRPRTIEVDIAEDGTRFVIDEAPVFDDGFPAHGNAFITQGYIYPAGTLTDSNGVNPDGTPEFPDEVIGEWSCSGYFIGEGAHATEGAWVYTTQLFAFGDDPETGAETLVVTGYEGAEVGARSTGAITGGTGTYATASGEAAQELIGINNPELPTMGINKTVELEIERREHRLPPRSTCTNWRPTMTDQSQHLTRPDANQ